MWWLILKFINKLKKRLIYSTPNRCHRFSLINSVGQYPVETDAKACKLKRLQTSGQVANHPDELQMQTKIIHRFHLVDSTVLKDHSRMLIDLLQFLTLFLNRMTLASTVAYDVYEVHVRNCSTTSSSVVGMTHSDLVHRWTSVVSPAKQHFSLAQLTSTYPRTTFNRSTM